jgi:hypothetical protein
MRFIFIAGGIDNVLHSDNSIISPPAHCDQNTYELNYWRWKANKYGHELDYDKRKKA